MDAIIIFGTIPTLWPLLKVFSGKCIFRPRNVARYEQIRYAPDCEDRGDALHLSGWMQNRKSGPATRLLEEVDGMRTTCSVTGGS